MDADTIARNALERFIVQIRREIMASAQAMIDNSLAPITGGTNVIDGSVLGYYTGEPGLVVYGPTGNEGGPGSADQPARGNHTHALIDTVGGDLNGTMPNPTVDGIRGVGVSAVAPVSGQALIYNGTVYAPATVLVSAGDVLSLLITNGDTSNPELLFDENADVMWDA